MRLERVSVAAIAPIERLFDPAYPEAWREIATCLYLLLLEVEHLAPAGDDGVARVALALAEGLRAEIGGSQPYLPVGRDYEITQRDREIFRRFTGHNHAELARAYELTPRQIYTIVARCLREDFHRRQGCLELEGADANTAL